MTAWPAGSQRRAVIRAVTVLTLIVVFPLIAPGNAVSLGFVALQYVVFALGLNIIVGWIGLLDLGAAGFVAVGAYTTAIVMTQFHWSPLIVLPTATLAGGLAGFVLGVPTLRHRADYFAILTLGFAELVALTIRNWPAVTKGSYGYSGIPPYFLPFMDAPLRTVPPVGFYYLLAAVAVPSFLFCMWLRSTTFGRRCHVIKHSEAVASTKGINVVATKLIAFMISSALLATGGYFWTVYQRAIVWTEFGVVLSCLLLSLIIVGGIGNPIGAAAGAVVVGTAMELLRRIFTNTGVPQNARFLVFSCLLIAAVHIWPRGLIPDRPAWYRRLRADRMSAFSAISEREHSSHGSSPVLLVRGASKAYGGIVALDGVDLQIAHGDCLAVIGPNGSGKSTLLNGISGINRFDRGMVTLHGTTIQRMAPYRIARIGVARTFQDISVFDDLDVADNLYVAESAGSDTHVKESLRRFGLADEASACSSLSYGQKKMLDLARAFTNPSRLSLALLDEPTAGLSAPEALEVVNVLVALRTEYHIAMLLVSHDVKFLDAMRVDHAMVLHHGRVFASGSLDDVRDNREVRKLFWGDPATLSELERTRLDAESQSVWTFNKNSDLSDS